MILEAPYRIAAGGAPTEWNGPFSTSAPAMPLP